MVVRYLLMVLVFMVTLQAQSSVIEIVNKVKDKSYPIEGYFANFGDGAYDWIYLSKRGNLYKLEGMNADTGKLKWTYLSPFATITIKNNRLMVKKRPVKIDESRIEKLIKKLEKKSSPIQGYFIHYDKGSYDWIYLSRSGHLFKLEGMDIDTGHLNWLNLSPLLSAYIDKGNIVLKEKELEKATFIDNVVVNARYQDEYGHSGYTDKNGVFKYTRGSKVKFWAGKVYLGEAEPQEAPKDLNISTKKIVTPFTIAHATEANEKVLKITRFLLAIDIDNNDSNGIQLPKVEEKEEKNYNSNENNQSSSSALKEENETSSNENNQSIGKIVEEEKIKILEQNVSIDQLELDKLPIKPPPPQKAVEHLEKTLKIKVDVSKITNKKGKKEHKSSSHKSYTIPSNSKKNSHTKSSYSKNPTITLNGESNITIILGNPYTELGAKAVDSNGNELEVIIDSSNLKVYNLGSYQVVYRAKDANGNEATATRIVNIVSPEVLIKDFNVQKKACGNFAGIKIDGYTYKNNTWGRNKVPEDEDWVQCAFSYVDENSTLKGGFYWGWPNGQGGVKGYPEAIYGRKFRQNLNPESGWPVKVSELKEIVSHIKYRDINFTGSYNIAPEWWLHLDKDASMDNIKYEIMVRLDPKGMHPSHPWFENVNIEGVVYDVYKDEPWGENKRQFFNFVVKSKIKDFILHPNAFMEFLVSKGVSDIPNLYYADVEMGVEVWNGSGLFVLDRFSVQQAKKPVTSIEFGKEYSYEPDINDSSLRYTITNKPDWATFDEKSGKLSGIPDEAKLYRNIEITATNGVQNIKIARFDLNVLDVSKANIKANEPFEKKMTLLENATYSVQNAPKGLMIQPKTGVIYWTPTNEQVGEYTIEVTAKNKQTAKTAQLILTVLSNPMKYSGYFVDLSGVSQDRDGSSTKPFGKFADACKVAKPGDHIYIRGGVYHNPGFGNGNKNNPSLAPIKGCVGEKGKEIIIEPWGNELVKIKFDSFYGLKILDSQYVKVKGFEIEGMAQEISYEEAMNNWWRGDRYYNGDGIGVTEGTDRVTKDIIIENMVVHDTPGAGIKAYKATNVTIKDNIVYNTNWWTIKGTTAVGIVLAPKGDSDEDNKTKNRIVNNLLFGTEQRIFSREWEKSSAKLVIDEGEAILVQEGMRFEGDENGDKRTGYEGRYLIQNNLVLYNGKGVVSNLANRVDFINNSLYMNGTTAVNPETNLTSAGVFINASDDVYLKYNLIEAKDNGIVLWTSKDATNIKKEQNYAKGKFLDFVDNSGIEKRDKIFKDPLALDFTPAQDIPSSSGARLSDDVQALLQKYAIEVKPTNWDVNYTDVTKRIIDTIPEGAEVNWSSWKDSEPFELKITNIPPLDNGVKRREEFTLKIFYPYKRENSEPIDITAKYPKFLKTTQGSTYGNYKASLAIDGNESTYSHTHCNSNDNWWQLELPDGTKVKKVSIKSRTDGYINRIEDAKVYISTKPYGTDLGKEDAVLHGTSAWQDIELDKFKPAKYVIVKAKDDNCLHMAEVKVYGSVVQKPIISSVDVLRPKISPDINSNTTVAKVNAYDLQDDPLSYTISNSVPFKIDNQGNIKVAGSLDYDTTYTIDVAVSDGTYTATTDVTIQTTAQDALERALKSGDASIVSLDELYEAMSKVDVGDQQCIDRLNFIYSNEIPDNPYKGYADHFISTNVVNTPILGGYEENKNVYYGFMGEKRNGARYAMIGAPLRTLEAHMKTPIANLFKWLSKKENSENIFKEPLVILVNANAKNDLQNWLDSNDIATNWTITEDTSLLDSGNFDIYIAQIETTQNYKKAIQKGKAVIIYDRPTWEQREYFNLQYTVWRDTQGKWTSFKDVCSDVAKQRKNVIRLIKHLRDEDIDIVYTSDDVKEPTGYDKNSNLSLKELVFEPTNSLRAELKSLDNDNINIFNSSIPTDKFLKLALLIADKYRQEIHYPMDKDTTEDAKFYKAHFADSAILYSRYNKTQPDLGNFSRSDFSHITPTNKTVHLISKKPFRAAGVYVLPGETVTITRKDSNDTLVVKAFVNSIRPSSTHQFEKNGYKRPKYLQSNHIEIKAGETISFSSPYGGPLQIEFGDNGVNVSLEIKNIGLHPFWSEFDSDPNKDSKFEQALDANEYDWAELITSAFEVHSKRDKMIESIQEVLKKYPYEGASGLAEATKLYLSSYPMALAGYRGSGIASFEDVVSYAKLKDIPIYVTDFVKHMNADQATCGYGCSGNPYDAFWAFDPVGFGDIHEVGHSLERALFLLKGGKDKKQWEGHSRTNQYVYYSLIKYNQYIEQNNFDTKYYKIDHHIQKEVFEEQYNALQKCVGSADIPECMQDYWNNSDYRGQSLFMIEAMMNAKKYATGDYALDEGFHLLTRIHLLERYLQREATKDWENNRAKIGFSNYSLDEIKQFIYHPNDALNANDWMLISLSWASGLDFRPYFDMFGMLYSQKASEQVESFGFVPVKKVYFATDKDTGFILPKSLDPAGSYLDKKELPVDGQSKYDSNNSE